MTKALPLTSLCLAATLQATTLWASGPGEAAIGGEAVSYLAAGAFTYALFEQAVPHVDLAECPAEFDPEVVFCRMTLANDAANVFVFALGGEQPLLAVKSYALDDEFLPF